MAAQASESFARFKQALDKVARGAETLGIETCAPVTGKALGTRRVVGGSMVRGVDGTLVPDALRREASRSDAADSIAPTDTVLALDGISVRFGGISALDRVSLTVPRGVVCGLIGPNGAGKTTLFDVISGVRNPNEGRVWLDGKDATHWSAVTRARRGLRRTFQRVQTFGWLSVEDNVLAATEWHGGGGGLLADFVRLPTRRSRERQRRERVAQVLEDCGLTAVRREPAGSLPIGLARMVEFARAIVDDPKLVLLDEPTSGLDEFESERLVEQLQKLRTGSSCSVVLVEHDMSFVMDQCETIAVLDLGRVLTIGEPKDIQADPAVRAAYLGEGPARTKPGKSQPQGGIL
jgi:branched-chain amino acid transport system ATP-binding protein